jgi:protein gp37
MAKTGIEWTDDSWNPIVGCSVVSPGCTNCYAMKMAARLEAMGTVPHYAGTTTPSKAGAVWTGKLALAPDATLLAPLRRRKPTTYFVNSMGDLFHEDVPDEWIDRVFAIMALTPQHTYQILTKRSARMRKYMQPTTQLPILGRLPLERIHFDAQSDAEPWESLKRYGNLYSLYCSVPWPLPNAWLGVSAEDQRRADERVPDLLATPAAIRFVSAEPLLGRIDFRNIKPADRYEIDALLGFDYDQGTACARLDQIIVGGESGPRPMHPDWARQIRDDCTAAGTAFFFKQWGDYLPAGQMQANGKLWSPGCGTSLRATKGIAGRFLDGVEHNAMPGRLA